jgi:hypothetical protein
MGADCGFSARNSCLGASKTINVGGAVLFISGAGKHFAARDDNLGLRRLPTEWGFRRAWIIEIFSSKGYIWAS